MFKCPRLTGIYVDFCVLELYVFKRILSVMLLILLAPWLL